MSRYKPDNKVLAAAVALVVVWAVSLTGVSYPPGLEGAVAVIVAYLVPNQKPAQVTWNHTDDV